MAGAVFAIVATLTAGPASVAYAVGGVTEASGFPVSSELLGGDTLNVNLQHVGDLVILESQIHSQSITVSSVNCPKTGTWQQAEEFVDSTNGLITEEIWWAVATTTGASTITVTYSGSIAALSPELVGDSFTASGEASWSAIAAGGQAGSTTTTINFPSVSSSTAPNEIYWGYAESTQTAAGGSSPGFTYSLTGAGNVVASDAALNTSTPYAPTASESPPSNYTATAAIFAESATLAPVAVSAAAVSSTDVIVVGRSPLSNLWYQQSSGGGASWTGWQSLSTTDAASQPAVVVSGSNTYVFFRASDNELHYFERVGSTWGTEQNLGGLIAGNPAAAVDGNGQIIVATLNDAGNVFEDSLPSGGSWAGWTSLAGVLTGNISLATLGGNVYLLGLNGAGLGWTIEWTAGSTNTWGSWTSLGGVFASGTTLSGAAYSATLHVLGINAQGDLFESTGSGSSWSAWTNLNGILAATPSLAVPSSGLFMFDVNPAGLLWDQENTSSWQGWNPLSGGLEGATVAAAAGANAFVFDLNGAGNLWYREWNGTSFGAWTSLGGILATA